MKGKVVKKGVDDALLSLPTELLQETYARKEHAASFDKVDFVLKFRAGKKGIGATVKGFQNSISEHDVCVKLIEEKIDEAYVLKRDLTRVNRLFRNMDSSWNAINEANSLNFEEYRELEPKMNNVELRLADLQDPEAAATLQAHYDRYLELKPRCANQMLIFEAYNKSREEKDEALRAYMNANKELADLKSEEKHIAKLITSDHIKADKKKLTLPELFPNIHAGYIMSTLNGDFVEELPYLDVLQKIYLAKPPNEVTFKRYDYRFNPFELKWSSLQELREDGVCVEDPMIQKSQFIHYAAAGDVQKVRQCLLEGEDPDCQDYTGATAVLVAAVNRHSGVVELLHKAKCNVNLRDKNLMTPLLYCVSTGLVPLVRQLISYGAEKFATDKNDRGAVYYAVVSGNENMIKFFLRPETKNKQDALWGFTPLHQAASQGNEESVRSLLNYNCSIYSKDKQKRIPEDVALEFGFRNVYDLLVEERVNAPAQEVYIDESKNVAFWIGDKEAMRAQWCSDLDFTHIIYFKPNKKEISSHFKWLIADKKIELTVYDLVLADPDNDEDDEENDGYIDDWKVLNHSDMFPKILDYVLGVVKRGNAVILFCDETGDSTSPTIYALLTLIRYQFRVEETIPYLKTCRRGIDITKSFRKGLSQMQKDMDKKMINRLNSKLRKSPAISIGF